VANSTLFNAKRKMPLFQKPMTADELIRGLPGEQLVRQGLADFNPASAPFQPVWFVSRDRG